MKSKFLGTMAVLFCLITGGLFVLHAAIPAYSFVLMEAGNVVMALLSFIAFALVQQHIDKPGNAFVRGVSGASFLKLMVCMVAMLIYIVLNRQHLHKPSIFILFGIYAIYTTSETLLLSKMARTVK